MTYLPSVKSFSKVAAWKHSGSLHGTQGTYQPQAVPLLPFILCPRMRVLLRLQTYTAAIALSSLISVTLLLYTVSSGGIRATVKGGSLFSNYHQINHLEHAVETLKSKLSEAEAYEKELLGKIEDLQEQANSEHASTIQVRGNDERSGWEGVGDSPGNARGNNGNQIQQQIYSCKHTDIIKVGKTIGQGHTKVVQEGTLLGRKVAVKSAGMQVKSVKDCLERGIYHKKEDCLLLAMYKVLKEAMILRQVRHPNIVKLIGLCARSEIGSPNIKERGITLVVELGRPVHLHELVEESWARRVKYCIEIGRLLQYLEDSPMGSTTISDFRDEQFVMVDGVLKLSDVDDLSSTEPDCDQNMECLVNGKSAVKCSSNMKCAGLNAHLNLLYAYEVFIGPLLSRDVPPSLQTATKNLLKSLKKGELDAEGMVYRLKNLQAIP
nr:extracellular tyrosine-protein kinase PKDCC-like [Lytechinus pictus]